MTIAVVIGVTNDEIKGKKEIDNYLVTASVCLSDVVTGVYIFTKCSRIIISVNGNNPAERKLKLCIKNIRSMNKLKSETWHDFHHTSSTDNVDCVNVQSSHFSSVTSGCLRSVLLARRRSALKCCDYTSCFPAFQHNWHAMQLCSLQPRFKGASQSVFDLVLYFCVDALLSTQTDARVLHSHISCHPKMHWKRSES